MSSSVRKMSSQKDEQLSQKDEQLSEQQNLLRTSIQLFLKSGLSLEKIAANLGKTTDELRQIIK